MLWLRKCEQRDHVPSASGAATAHKVEGGCVELEALLAWILSDHNKQRPHQTHSGVRNTPVTQGFCCMTWSALTNTQVRSTTCRPQRTELQVQRCIPSYLQCLHVESHRQIKTTMSKTKCLIFHPLPLCFHLLPLQFSISANTCARGRPPAVIPDTPSCPTSTSNAHQDSKTFQTHTPLVTSSAASLLQASHISCLDQQP